MVPHHELGVRLIDIAAMQADDVRLRELAFEMSGYHVSELVLLRRWRATWSLSPGSPRSPDAAHRDHGADGALGMLDESEIADLTARLGTDFDRRWLQLMIRHHEGGVAMADDELAAGRSHPARQLAAQIAAVQRQQIRAMQSLLTLLG